jgi:hypothetical protein
MSVPGQQFSYGPSNVDALLSTTLAAIPKKKFADNIFTKIPLFMWFKKKAKMTVDGGANLMLPLMYGKNSTAKSYSGYGIIDTTPQEGLTAASYLWAQYAATISISGLEERVQNVGDKAIIKLLESKVTQAEMSLADKLDIDLWASAVTGTNINTVVTLVDQTTSTGQVSKSSNSWWQCQTTASGSFAARGLADMRNLYNNITNQSLAKGAPDLICSDQASYQYYEATVQPQLRYSDTDMADAGFENLRFKGATMTYDPNTPSGKMYMLSSDALKLVTNKGTNFITTKFVVPANQDAKVAQILWAGQLASDNIRRLGSLTGITA